MADTVGDFFLSRLRDWGVERVFSYPGDGINGLLAAWGRADNHLRLSRPAMRRLDGASATA